MNKEVCKLYSMNVKSTRSKYYGEKLKHASGDQKKTWRILKSIVKGVSNDCNEIDLNGTIKHDNKDIAVSFNYYFIDSVKEINVSIPNNNLDECDIKKVTESEF